jgi:hypothetical protein
MSTASRGSIFISQLISTPLFARILIKPARQTANCPLSRQTRQRLVHGIPSSKVQKVIRGEGRTLPVP